MFSFMVHLSRVVDALGLSTVQLIIPILPVSRDNVQLLHCFFKR